MENSNVINQAHTQNIISGDFKEKILNGIEYVVINGVYVWVNLSRKDGIKVGDKHYE